MDWLNESTGWIREQVAALPWWSDAVRSTIQRAPEWTVAAAALALIVTLAALAAWRHKPRRPVTRVTSAGAVNAAALDSSSGSRARGVATEIVSGDENRAARVFVSSAFLDMQGERDILVRRTFPALRAVWRAKGVDVFEVDLRWGVTEDQVKPGRLLPIILREIDRCNYFIAVLGDRYGREWTEDEIDERLKGTFPALVNAAGMSLTEIEIAHAVLANPAKAKRALFFLRDPAWAAALDQAARTALGVEPGAALDKLAALKNRIEQSGADVMGYADLQDLGVKVEAALSALLAADFPAAEAPDAFNQTQRLNGAYSRERLGLHVGADPYIAALDAWVQRDASSGVLITGASGGGKSTLIANWLSRRRANSPGDIIFEHYLGASPESADPALLVRHLWELLNRATSENIEAPSEERALFDALPQRLAQASAVASSKGRRIFIALDGLDKLTRQQDLRWLPQFLPLGVKLLASALEGESNSAAIARGWEELAVKPLTAEQQRLFVTHTLQAWGRELSQARTQRVLAHPLSANPLFLKTLLDELRVSATEDALDARLDFYLGATAMPDLFARLLQRLEGDCAPGLAANALSLIWASRAGLEESEIIALTAAAPLAWAQLRNGLGEGLRDQLGRLAFSHDFLRQAVEAHYLGSAEKRRAAHLAIADRFEALPADARQAEELPFQLRAALAWDRLEALLVDLDRFTPLRARGDNELWSYWRALKDHGRDPEVLLCSVFETRAGEAPNWKQADVELAFELTSFLDYCGTIGATRARLQRSIVVGCERLFRSGHPRVASSLNNLGTLLYTSNRHTEAESFFRRALAIFETNFGPDHSEVAHALNNLATLLFSTNRLAEAEPLFRRVLVIFESSFGPRHPKVAAALGNLAELLSATNRRGEAEPLMRRALAIDEAWFGPEHHDVAIRLSNLANLLQETNGPHLAEPLFRRALAILEGTLGPDHPKVATALNNLARWLTTISRYDEAEALLRRALAIDEKSVGSDHPAVATTLNNLAALLLSTNRHVEAETLLRRALDINERSFGSEHPDVATALNNLAELLRATGRCAQAEPLLKRALAVLDRSLGPNHPDTASCLNNLALVLEAADRRGEAEALYRRVLTSMEASFGSNHPSVATALNNLAALLCATNRRAEAERLYRQALAIFEAILGRDHPSTQTAAENLSNCLVDGGSRPKP